MPGPIPDAVISKMIGELSPESNYINNALNANKERRRQEIIRTLPQVYATKKEVDELRGEIDNLTMLYVELIALLSPPVKEQEQDVTPPEELTWEGRDKSVKKDKKSKKKQ